MNQYYNKRMAELQKENPYCYRLKENPITNDLEYKKDLKKNLKPNEKYKSFKTKRMINLIYKRDNKINDYIFKSSKIIIDYCLNNEITKIVLGYSNDFQKGFEYSSDYNLKNNYLKHIEKNIIKSNNQRFLSIPFGKIKLRLEYLCKNHKIDLIIQEESYTSRASFMDLDEIPVYNKEENKEYTFSGKRIKRGLYETKDKKYINADINGALNIYRKSSVCDMEVISNLLRRGVSTPRRLQVI
jgi:IS605 OrfB family transposase